MLLAAKVELGPIAIPVERDAVAGLVACVDILERVEIDETGVRVGEEAKSDFVLGVWLGEEVVED